MGAAFAAPVRAQTNYPLGPDSQTKENVPHGKTTHYTYKNSRIFPATERDYWVYVPAQYDQSKPACVMVFQDGGGWQDAKGQFRVPVVFDNLIASGEMPVCVAIMVNPGIVPAARENALPRFNRAVEYDTPSDAYARFLTGELLPEVGKTIKLTSDPNERAIAGTSSGGIAAFTAAWTRPDLFRRVVSFIGSFTDLRGGNTYPSQIRKMEPKPLRVFLQDGSQDLDIYSGSWFDANTNLAHALQFSGYKYQFVTGDNGHNGQQGASLLPDALRFIWKDYPNPVAAKANDKQPVLQVVSANESWELVYDGAGKVGGLCADSNGNVMLSDTGADALILLGVGNPTPIALVAKAGGAEAIAFAPDGKIIASQPAKNRVVSFDAAASGKETVRVKSIAASAVTVGSDGMIYATDTHEGRLYGVSAKNTVTALDADLPGGGRGICLSPDQSLLFVTPPKTTNSAAKQVYSYQLTEGGKAAYRENYHDLPLLPISAGDTGAAGMTTDTEGRLYVATQIGIAVCDQAGRTIGIIAPPLINAPVSQIVFGGKNSGVLYAASGNRVYKRQTKAVGVHSQNAPIKPPAPNL